MINNQKIMYNETFYILKRLGKNYIEKLPKSLYKFIKEEKDENYEIILNEKENIAKQISLNTIAFISYLNLMYWCDDPKEKEMLVNIYFENDQKEERLKREKYNPDNIFKNKQQTVVKEPINIVKYKENILKKIVNKILSFLKIKK